jgi:hypothetical protein
MNTAIARKYTKTPTTRLKAVALREAMARPPGIRRGVVAQTVAELIAGLPLTI